MESWRLRNGAKAVIGNINFGDSISGFFQKNIEAIFFRRFKRQWKSQNKLPEAYVLTRDRKVGKPITKTHKDTTTSVTVGDIRLNN
jgi:hypothetical protein